MTIARNEPAEIGAYDENDESIARYLGLNPNSPADRAMVAVCRAYDLDPVLKHVVVIPKGGVYITRDGLLHIAHRSGQLDGIVVEQDPTLVDGEWIAKVSVYRKDMRYPFTFPGRYSMSGSNRQYAQEMALKAAEAHALRRAFAVTGLPTLDEQRPDPEPAQTAPTAAARMKGLLGAPADPEPEQPTPLDTGSPLARAMFAAMGEAGITDRDDRLAYVSSVVGRDVTSSKEMSEDDARAVLDALEHRGQEDGE